MTISIALNLKIKIKKFSLSLYWIFCLVGAIVCLIFGFAGESPVKNIFFSQASINPLKILIIFLSCTSISVLLDKIGFFSYIANVILQKSKQSQTKLFFSFSIFIAILTIFTSNDILILTFTSFICYFTKNAKIDPTPYIISEFAYANIWSMFLLIGNPTNIYVGESFGLNFVNYALKMAIPTAVCGLFATMLVYLLFRKKLKEKISIGDIEIKKPNTALLSIALSGLIVMVIMMAISNYIGLQLWYVPLACSLLTYMITIVFLLAKKTGLSVVWNSALNLPYNLIPFLLSMSVFVATLNNIGFISIFADFLSTQNIFIVCLIAFVLGNLLNNIPMTMLFTMTLSTFSANINIIYGVVAASNICALLTPIGSLAGIMFMNILKNNDIKYSFKQFVGYGSIISIPTILIALLLIAVI